ncbi:Probable aconitate hydratase 2 [Taphrina deformans PYCC 5710]|uniref:Aconitate hydratase, mitochondrial n=1 Tax=Taphrina deformans (strain PYCC 5710 / ATCC 11124 / CBS 356.35 / IMI 108563 / JCM 9778 / NBRC 8474) TaxID=1097556 RepID=R4XH08_TAPDE|nr:Probable aconitate hydratase 2 [Taphrina deformans PYCC 5710]|eukprot:CCG82651.1 Probable aconitate hydratase 2 [Taphrina deformans PYCC 5710]
MDEKRITPPYEHLTTQLAEVRRILGAKPLTLAEKILYSHLVSPEESLAGKDGDIRGNCYLKLNPDRVAMQDASAQMALLQFLTCGLPTSSVPASVHCDHLIVGHQGAQQDIESSVVNNKEIFDFLESASKKYGLQFWGPGSGIIHQIVLENYAAPGGMMLGTDSHTPNAGGLGMVAIGVGGADAVDAMTNTPWELKAPKIIGVKLTGKMNAWTSPKDLIMYLAGKLTVRGGTGHVIEYFGKGVENLSCTGMATICNMGAEVGATTSLFPYTKSMQSYLKATHRSFVANAADEAHQKHQYLSADSDAQYDQLIEVNLDTLEPYINGPFTPDLATPLSGMKQAIETNGWPKSLSVGLIGSCTNSSYEDMSRVTDIIRQASAVGLKPKTPLLVTPGSEQIRATIERDGLTDVLEAAGATVLANACGPCIGQWQRTDVSPTTGSPIEENAILTSFNRNFKARNDGNAKTMNFLASPEIVAAKIFSENLAFDPTKDELLDPQGNAFRFSAPTGTELPANGFEVGNYSYLPPAAPNPESDVQIKVDPLSDRLELLEPFPAFNGSEFTDLKVVVKVKGKCTTDHISAAGSWLKYKGHLTNICKNTLIGAVNAETGETNKAYDVDGTAMTIPDLMESWRDRGQEWLIVAEHNYGEGSAREHAALQPRALNGRIILSKSFARIHETNLKKQGILPLTFANEADYDLISACDSVSTSGIADLIGETGEQARIVVNVISKDGKKITIECKHTMSSDQIEFFKAGSALNLIASKAQIKATQSSARL